MSKFYIYKTSIGKTNLPDNFITSYAIIDSSTHYDGYFSNDGYYYDIHGDKYITTTSQDQFNSLLNNNSALFTNFIAAEQTKEQQQMNELRQVIANSAKEYDKNKQLFQQFLAWKNMQDGYV